MTTDTRNHSETRRRRTRWLLAAILLLATLVLASAVGRLAEHVVGTGDAGRVADDRRVVPAKVAGEDEDLLAFERTLDAGLGGMPVMALCTYSLDTSVPGALGRMIDVLSHHSAAYLGSGGRALARSGSTADEGRVGPGRLPGEDGVTGTGASADWVSWACAEFLRRDDLTTAAVTDTWRAARGN